MTVGRFRLGIVGEDDNDGAAPEGEQRRLLLCFFVGHKSGDLAQHPSDETASA
jgi:hypothetical protein